MNAKEKLLLAIHRSFRKDRWINELFHAAGISFDEIQHRLQEIDDQNFIDTATWGLKLYEKDLGIITKKTTSIENRRAEIEARWKTVKPSFNLKKAESRYLLSVHEGFQKK